MTEPRFKSGEEAGRYRIQQPLGEGGMGLVYLATDESDYKVALKFLLTDDPEGRARLRREAASAARIQHRNVVRIYRVDYLGEEPFIVSEYVVGLDLTRIGPRARDEILVILRQVAEGLAAAHAAGVVHRDITPANIVLKADGTAVIVDFGLGKRESLDQNETTQEILTRANTVHGTPCYMSPERVTEGKAGPPSDIFSFGLLAFELLAGRNLFQRGSDMATIVAVATDPIPKLIDACPDLPAHIAEILDRCLAREPSQRPTAEQVARQIDTLADTVVRTPSGVRGVTADAPKSMGSTVASTNVAEPSSAAVKKAIDAVKQVTPDRQSLVNSAMAEITETLEGLAPKALNGEGDAGALVRSLEGTVDCVRDAALLSITIAAMADGDAAWAQYTGLMRLLEDYDPPAGQAVAPSLLDLDYYRFLGHELFLGQIAALIREKRWSMIDDVLSTGIPLENCAEAGETKVVFFDSFSEYLETLEPLARERNRASLHADLLCARHSEDPLTDGLPFHELIAADFFLFLRTELSTADFIWRPWSAPYFRGVPRFVLDVERDHPEQVASALGIPSAHGLRDRLLALAVRLAFLRRAGVLSLPLRTEELHQIS